MPATKFWICDKCGFANSPHLNRVTDEQNTKCEQCGGETGTDLAAAELLRIKGGR